MDRRKKWKPHLFPFGSSLSTVTLERERSSGNMSPNPAQPSSHSLPNTDKHTHLRTHNSWDTRETLKYEGT